MNWWQRLGRRGRMERELNTELQFHFESLVDDYIRAGLSEEDARRRARLEFGGVEQVKEDCRDARGTRWVHDIAQDLRFASRLLVRERALSTVAVLALALGIGVNNTLFTILNAVCLRGLRVDGIERLADISSQDVSGRRQPISPAEFEALRTDVPAFDGVAAYATVTGTIGDPGRAPDRVLVAFVSANARRLIRQTPQIGRDVQDEDDQPGAARVVVLGQGIWKTRYAADLSIVGRSVLVSDMPATVIGVMPDGVRFPDNADLWQPLAAMPGLAANKTERRLGVFARLRDDMTMTRAGEQVRALSASLARVRPQTNAGIQLTASPLNDRFKGRVTDPAWLAFITVGVLLVVIACSNVANLLLARAVHRSREIAIRLSIGATRGRIFRQLLAESLLLAALGGLAGLGVSVIGLRVFRNAIPPSGLPYWVTLTMDARVIAVLGAVCLGTVALFGLAPAVHALRTGVNDVLKETGLSASSGVRASRWSAVFLTTQIGIAVILLSAVGLSVQWFRSLQRSSEVIRTSELLTVWLSLPADTYKTADQRLAFFGQVQERLSGIGAIASASLANALPFSGAAPRRVKVEGQVPAGGVLPTVWSVAVGREYFATLGLPVLQGRAFAETDGAPGSPSVIVNQRFAQMFFPDQSALGRRIGLAAPSGAADTMTNGKELTIVGVTSTIRQRPVPEPDPVVYLPLRMAAPATVAILVRATGDPASLAPLLRNEVRQVDARVPLYRVMPLDQVNWEAQWNGRVSGGLILVIAFIALGLATFGLAALTAHAVAQRTREIGIRMALGARRGEVMRLVLRRAASQVAVGLIAGAIGAKIWERLFASPGLSSVANLLTVAVVITLVALAACVWPARQAARLDPLRALRHQ